MEANAGISHSTINKLNCRDNIKTEVLIRICLALNCTIDVTIEIILKNAFEI